MAYKNRTITVDVDVDIDFDDFDDDELVAELEHRGYTVSKEEPAEGFDQEDWQFLLEMLDKNPQTWYTLRVRNKLLEARFG